MGIGVSQKMHVTGGLLGCSLGKGIAFSSSGFGHTLGLTVLASELDRRVRFS